MPGRSSEGMDPFCSYFAPGLPTPSTSKEVLNGVKLTTLLQISIISLTVATNWHAYGYTLHSSKWPSGQAQLGRVNQKGWIPAESGNHGDLIEMWWIAPWQLRLGVAVREGEGSFQHPFSCPGGWSTASHFRQYLIITTTIPSPHVLKNVDLWCHASRTMNLQACNAEIQLGHPMRTQDWNYCFACTQKSQFTWAKQNNQCEQQREKTEAGVKLNVSNFPCCNTDTIMRAFSSSRMDCQHQCHHGMSLLPSYFQIPFL